MLQRVAAKAKPIARWGRKALDLNETAGLPDNKVIRLFLFFIMNIVEDTGHDSASTLYYYHGEYIRLEVEVS